MRRLVGIALVAFVLMPPASAQTQPTEPTHRIAVILRVPMLTRIIDAAGKTLVDGPHFDALTRSLLRWRKSPLAEVPLSLAVSPALCDALRLADQPQAKRTLSALRRVAQRADVLSVPYADVWLPYLAGSDAVEEQFELGRSTLRRCLGRDATSSVFAHVLHTGEGEPTQDIDTEAVDAAKRMHLEHIVARGITQTPVSSDDVTVVPFTDIGSLALDEDGAVREPAGVRFALVADAQAPEELNVLERLQESVSVATVRLADLAKDAPSVAVALPDDPDVPRRFREPVTRAREAVDRFVGVTLDDNPIRTSVKLAFADVVASASKDAEVYAELGELRDVGAGAAEDLLRYVGAQLRRITVAQGSVTFTSRRGSVPVTVANRTSYPVRVRVSVSSPKLTFPNGPTRVVTIEPPGDTITFEANARSTGTFPTLAVVKDRKTGVTIDRAELTVRSTATNLSALILTGGGAIFLLVFLVRRASRRRATGNERSDDR